MMEGRIVVILLAMSVALSSAQYGYYGMADFVRQEERLRADLLGNYSVKTRPFFKTYIYVSNFISSLNNLNIATQSMSANMMLVAAWLDQRLQWNSSNYGGLESLVTAPEDVWTPPLVIENSVDDVGVIGGANRDATPVRITSNGIVVWNPPTEVTTSCEMLIAHYPFDTQTCSILLIGWTYPLSEMDIITGPVNFTDYSPNGEFDLIDAKTYYEDIGGPAESETYRKVVFELTFRRKWQFYGQNLLLPIVLNSILMTAVFALPIESGEKMSYCLTVLLSYIVFLTWVTENLPPVSTDTSILQVYLAVVLCLGCLATLVTNWVLHLYHKSDVHPVCGCYLALARRVLRPLQGCCQRERPDDKGNRETDCTQANGHVARAGDGMPVVEGGGARGRYQGTVGLAGKEIDPAVVIFTRDRGQKAARPGGTDIDPSVVTFTRGRGQKDSHPALTWQELATLFDFFFFWVFSVALLIVTVIIMCLLYINY